jgi:hypothetical protein
MQQQHRRRLWDALLKVGDPESGREANAAGDPISPHVLMLGRNVWRTSNPGEPFSASGDDSASTSTDAGTPRAVNERRSPSAHGWRQVEGP